MTVFQIGGRATRFAVPLLDNIELSVIFMDFEPDQDSEFMRDADDALANFLKLNPSYRVAISEYVHKNCTDFLAAVGFDDADDALRQIQNKEEIWDFVQPGQLYVSRRHRRDEDIYISIACNCDWEQEHGLQLVFRQGKQLTRVSDQDGHLTDADAYGMADDEDVLLAAFKA